jgi:hypothetical protein
MFHSIMAARPVVSAELEVKLLAGEEIDQTSITRMLFGKYNAAPWVIAVLRTNFFE